MLNEPIGRERRRRTEHLRILRRRIYLGDYPTDEILEIAIVRLLRELADEKHPAGVPA